MTAKIILQQVRCHPSSYHVVPVVFCTGSYFKITICPISTNILSSAVSGSPSNLLINKGQSKLYCCRWISHHQLCGICTPETISSGRWVNCFLHALMLVFSLVFCNHKLWHTNLWLETKLMPNWSVSVPLDCIIELIDQKPRILCD